MHESAIVSLQHARYFCGYFLKTLVISQTPFNTLVTFTYTSNITVTFFYASENFTGTKKDWVSYKKYYVILCKKAETGITIL